MYAVHPDEEWLGEPHEGDFNQGEGVATQQLQNPNLSLASAKSFRGNPWTASPGVWVAIVLLLVALGVVHRNHAGEYSRVRIGLENWFVVGMLAATFIFIFKTGLTAAAWVPAPVKQFFGAL